MRIRSIKPEFWAAGEINPRDLQSFKRFETAPPGQEFLYRLYGEEMELLYVGITWNPFARWTAHSRKHDWWDQVSHVDIYLCANERAARELETWCIKSLYPRHNKHQRKGWRA